MKVLVKRADDDWWYEIREFNTMEDIQRFIKEWRYGIVIEENDYTDDDYFIHWEGMKEEDIPIIKACPLVITIYNDYLE